MEEEVEALDWGNEDDEKSSLDMPARGQADTEDAEDAVSLGGDEDDSFYPYHAQNAQDTPHVYQTPPREEEKEEQISGQLQESASRSARIAESVHESIAAEDKDRQPADLQASPGRSPASGRGQMFAKLTHALPPKPVVSNVPFMHPSHPSIIEATVMSRRDRDKKNGIMSRSQPSQDGGDALPLEWEVRHPRGGGGVYYYNTITHQSTWTRPSARRPETPPPAEQNGLEMAPHSGNRSYGDKREHSHSTDRLDSARRDVDNQNSSGMSYQDRHYRPGESGRRDDRQHNLQSASAPSHLAAHRNRSLSPPRPRREEGHGQELRRQKPSAFTGERSAARPPPRDVNISGGNSPIRSERHWVSSRPSASGEKRAASYERRRPVDTDPFPPKSTLEDHDPRDDVARLPTLRSRSPVIATRDVRPPLLQEPIASVLVSEPTASAIPPRPPIRQKSRFSRPLGEDVQQPRESDSHILSTGSDKQTRDSGFSDKVQMVDLNAIRERIDERRTETLAALHLNASLAGLSRPVAAESSVTSPASPSPATTAEDQVRKRQPLPPQSESFRDGSKAPDGQPDSAAASAPAAGLSHHGLPAKPPPTMDTVPPEPHNRSRPFQRDSHSDSDHRSAPTGPSAGFVPRNRGVEGPLPAESLARDGEFDDNYPPGRASKPNDARPAYSGQPGFYEQDESVPRGPRAMGGKSAYMPPLDFSTTRTPANPSFLPRSSRASEYEQRNVTGRSPRSSRNELPDSRRDIYPDNHPRPSAGPLSERHIEPPSGFVGGSQQNRQSTYDRREMSRQLFSNDFIPKATGTNSVPIGHRPRGQSSAQNNFGFSQPPANAAGQRHGHPSTSNEPTWSVPRAPLPPREPYERSSRMDALPTGNFRPGLNDNSRRDHHNAQATSPSFRPTSPGPLEGSARPQRNWHVAGETRFGPSTARDDPHATERIWIPRRPSPDSQPRSAYPAADDHRNRTPPVSRESSAPAPWDIRSHHSDHAPSAGRPLESPRQSQFNFDRRISTEDLGGRRARDSYIERNTDARMPTEIRPRKNPIMLESRPSGHYDVRPHDNAQNRPFRRDHDEYPNSAPPQKLREEKSDRLVGNDMRGSKFEAGRFQASSPGQPHIERVRTVDHERGSAPFMDQDFGPPRGRGSSRPNAGRSNTLPQRPQGPSRFERPNDDIASVTEQDYAERRLPNDGSWIGPSVRSHERERPPVRRGVSLLDRLSLDMTSSAAAMEEEVTMDGEPGSASLRDRVQLPVKRDRDEMMANDEDMDFEDEGEDSLKRARRRNFKPKRGRKIG